jgi:hypothetical protein
VTVDVIGTWVNTTGSLFKLDLGNRGEGDRFVGHVT